MSRLKEQLDRHLARQPRLGTAVFIAPGAVVVGDVEIGDRSSIWYNAVLRGDINRIVIGHDTNIQDNAVLHLADEFPCLVGNWVTVGHAAIVHACTVGDEVLVGMGATILDGATIGRQSVVGANTLVPQHFEVPPGSLVLGTPGRVVRALGEEERARIRHWAEKYVANAAYCLERGHSRGPAA